MWRPNIFKLVTTRTHHGLFQTPRILRPMCGAGSMSSNTSERLLESDCLEIMDFLRDPFVASLIETHPNHLVAASSSSSSSWSSLPRDLGWLDWCDSPIATDSDAEASVDSDSDSGSGQKKKKQKQKQKRWETIVQAYIDSRDGGVTCEDVRTCFFFVSCLSPKPSMATITHGLYL